MKKMIGTLLIVSLFVAVSGCHSGTMRGVGSDVEALGQKMKK